MGTEDCNYSEAKSPLLLSNGSGRFRFGRRNSLNSLRAEFVAKLPQKLHAAVDLESDSLINFSNITTATSLSKGEKEYYEKQVAVLKSFAEVDSVVDESNHEEEEDNEEEQAQHEKAMMISNYANVILLAFKIYVTIKSGSTSIAASTLDSLLDLIAGIILWMTHLSMKNVNIYKYPIGKLRVQPVGIIIFAAVMATLGIIHYIEILND
ncbi:metal tolerance protein 4-like [Impatiens glandulifera]|uniref:metal tolerance protein 4-like n=1 Tax=Impatiens glandulifera TaxID=253017 RepID=UPI001FB14BD5|nr:metal tolerance protein 4-like [Impatiens glandulifera]